MIPNRTDYLYTEVKTATPQKLQLMLIEAALRSAGQAKQYWASQRNDAACQALIRSQNILAELLAVLNPRSADELVNRVSATYLFVYKSLIAANLEHSPAELDAAIQVLEVERDTWRLVCEQIGATGETELAASGTSFEA